MSSSSSIFAGRWHTTFGPMTLTQEGDRVRGSYLCNGSECPISGKVSDGRLTFTYQEARVRGEGWFEMRPRAKAFAGEFREAGAEDWGIWEGRRIGFDGLWDSTFGRLRLIEDGDHLRGFYEVDGEATITGTVEGNELTFTYREARAGGQGSFTLADDGLSFEGEWQAEGEDEPAVWEGKQVEPEPGRTWLVVLEAPWQKFLVEREYAFGHMLREFFARLAHVQVRHRYFANEDGLRRCCRDLHFLAESVALVIATHGERDGIKVMGKNIGFSALEEGLQDVENLQLLHFSACLLMKEPEAVERLQALSKELRAPISGYTTSVNWAASALIEFTYLELVLNRDHTPHEAGEAVVRMLSFAGDEGPEEDGFPAAGFTMVTPEK